MCRRPRSAPTRPSRCSASARIRKSIVRITAFRPRGPAARRQPIASVRFDSRRQNRGRWTMGGENKVKEQIERCVLAVWHGSLRVTLRRLLATLAASVVAVTAISAVPATDAQAERLIQISGARRTVSVTIAVGKTEDVHVDAPFSDITVGDPEVADVAPLTDQTLSILGKKIGTTRVTVYAEGKRQLGIFDIEVSYDVSRLATEI